MSTERIQTLWGRLTEEDQRFFAQDVDLCAVQFGFDRCSVVPSWKTDLPSPALLQRIVERWPLLSKDWQCRLLERLERAAWSCSDSPAEDPSRGRQTSPTRRQGLWSLHLVDCVTGQVEIVRTGLTKREVMLRWRYWKERKTGCVLVAWPEWMPALQLAIPTRSEVSEGVWIESQGKHAECLDSHAVYV